MIFEIVCHSWNAKEIGILQFSLSDSSLQDWERELTVFIYFLYICCCEREEEMKGGRKEGKGRKTGPLFNQLGTIFKIEKLSWLVECHKWRKDPSCLEKENVYCKE